MKKTLDKITFIAITILALLASNARAYSCKQLEGEVRMTAHKQTQLKSKDGETLEDLQWKRDQAKSKAVVLRSLQKLSTDYHTRVEELRKGNLKEILNKDAKEILKAIESRFTTVAKYTVMANGVFGGFGPETKHLHNQNALDYLKQYESFSKKSDKKIPFYEFMSSCDERLQLSEKERAKYFSKDLDEEEITDQLYDNSKVANFEIKPKLIKILRCKRFKRVQADIKDSSTSKIEVETFVNNFAEVMNGQRLKSSEHKDHFFNRNVEDILHSARQDRSFNTLGQLGVDTDEKKRSLKIAGSYKGDIDLENFNTLSNNYDLLSSTYKKTKEHVIDSISKNLGTDDSNRLDLAGVKRAIDDLKCSTGPECKKLDQRTSQEIATIINSAGKALGMKNAEVTAKNLLEKTPVLSNDFIKDTLELTRAGLSKEKVNKLSDEQIRNKFSEMISELNSMGGDTQKACNSDILKSYNPNEVNKCLRFLKSQNVKSLEKKYDREARETTKKIVEVYSENKKKYTALEKLKIYKLAEFGRQCSDSLQKGAPKSNGSDSCIKEGNPQKALSKLKESLTEISDIATLDVYAEETGTKGFDPEATSGLIELEQDVCVAEKKETIDTDFRNICTSLKQVIANKTSREEAIAKRNKERLDRSKAAEISDRHFYIQYNKETGTMRKMKRPRYAAFNHALKYGASQLNGIMTPVLNTQRLRGSLFGMQTSAIFMKQQKHWQTQAMERYYDLSNPNLGAGFYSGFQTTNSSGLSQGFAF